MIDYLFLLGGGDVLVFRPDDLILSQVCRVLIELVYEENRVFFAF